MPSQPWTKSNTLQNSLKNFKSLNTLVISFLCLSKADVQELLDVANMYEEYFNKIWPAGILFIKYYKRTIRNPNKNVSFRLN